MRFISLLTLLFLLTASTVQTRHTRRLIIVVTADVAAQANTVAKQLDAAGGEKTFTVGLSASGNAPATHYWCSWVMTTTEDTSFRSLTTSLRGTNKVRVFDGNSLTPQQVLTQVGLKPIKIPIT